MADKWLIIGTDVEHWGTKDANVIRYKMATPGTNTYEPWPDKNRHTYDKLGGIAFFKERTKKGDTFETFNQKAKTSARVQLKTEYVKVAGVTEKVAHEYLETVPDGKTSNNLYGLPTCDEAK